MTISEFLDFFFRQSHIEIGDGLFYVHSKSKSEIVNCNNVLLMTLSEKEYCLQHKNKILTIYNEASDSIYFLNMSKEKVASLELDKDSHSIKYKVRILENSNLLAFPDYKNNCICFIDYKGNWLNKLYIPSVKYIRNIHQISESLIVLDYFLYGNNDPKLPSNKFFKSEVYNITTDSCILKKEDSDNSYSIITNVSLFHLPCEIPNLKTSSWNNDKTIIHYVPVIKYSVVEPIYSYGEPIEFKSVTKFCDFSGNRIKDTPYSEISQCGEFYLTSCHFPSLSWELYGVLDKNFNEILPCLFRELSIEGDKIFIPQPDWGDKKSIILNLKTNRFELTLKSGEKILLPPNYYDCSFNAFENNPQLLKGHCNSDCGEELCGIIDIDGNLVLPALYTSIHPIHNNLYIAYLQETDDYTEPTKQILYIANNKVNICKKYINVELADSQDLVAESQDFYADTFNFFRTRIYEANSKTNVKFGLIDSLGKEILPPCYDYISFPKEGKVCYINNGKAGWYDIKNDCSHEFNKYSFIKSFTKDRAIVCEGEVNIRTISSRWGEIGGWDDANNSPFYGETYYEDIRGKIRVRFNKNHIEGLVDKFGEIVVEPKYQKIIPLTDLENYYVIMLHDKYGCINMDGKVIVPIVYEWFSVEVDDLDDRDGELAEVKFLLGKSSEVYGYNSNAEVVLKMSSRLFENKYVPDNYDSNDDNYDYDRDTYYALGGSDYDEWRNSGGNIDDMKDGMGF